MEKEFVPYKLAVKLKALGFDEPCLAFYYDKTKFLSLGENPKYLVDQRKASCIFGNEKHGVTLAPTFSQAFRWFREKYGLWSTLSYDEDDSGKMLWGINAFEYGIGPLFFLEEYDTYEEAELACLDRLIDVITNKKIFDFVTDL